MAIFTDTFNLKSFSYLEPQTSKHEFFIYSLFKVAT